MVLEVLSALIILAAPTGSTDTPWSGHPSRSLTTKVPVERELQPAPPPRLAGLQVEANLNGPVRHFLEFFKNRGRFIYGPWYAKMGRYQAMMEPILEAHGLPPEIIYICMIESGFNPDAVSRAAAVGPWQFMRSTGGEYDLRFDEWIDERRDPVKATVAAARHLKDLHDRYGGWPLAFAAYNAGVGHVARAIKKANTNDFWRLSALGALPYGATQYAPKALAAMIVGTDPAYFGFAEIKRDAPWSFEEILVPGGADLERLAKLAGTSFATLNRLNPELRRGFTPPGEDYSLRVPPASAEALQKGLAKKMRTRVFLEYSMRFGERLIDVARDHGVSLRTLRRLNKVEGEPPHGKMILVPRVKGKAKGADDGELLVIQQPNLEFVTDGLKEVFFPIRRRYDLETVAGFFGVGPGQIALWNGLDRHGALRRGMVLRIFVDQDFDIRTAKLVDPAKTMRLTAGSDAVSNVLVHAGKTGKIKRVKHVVRRGQSLWTIAKRHGVTVKAIRAANGMSRRKGLSPGQTLLIPKPKSARPRGKAAKRAPKRGARGRTSYKVRRGDSLWKIAKKFGVTVKAIKRRNGMRRRSRLRPGQRLVIP